MVCPVCGKESEVDVFCRKCFLERNLKVAVPKSLNLFQCKRCKGYYVKETELYTGDLEEFVLQLFEQSMKANFAQVEREMGEPLDRRIEVEEISHNHFRIRLVIESGDFKLVKESIIKVKPSRCKDCNRATSGYYEAVLQLRGDFDKKAMVAKIRKLVNAMGGSKSFVSKVDKAKGGVDIYLGSKKAAEKIVNEYQKKAEIKRSKSIVGMNRKTQSIAYRFYYSIRF